MCAMRQYYVQRFVVSSLSPGLVKVLSFFGCVLDFGLGRSWAIALAVHRLRQKAVFRFVRWPCFGRAGRTSPGLAVFRNGRGRSVLAQNLVRWRKQITPPKNHTPIQRT